MTGLEHLIADREMRAILARLELISHGSVTAYNSSGGGGTDRLRPPGEHSPPHETYRRMYLAATSDEARKAVRDDARKALKAARRGPGTVPTTVTGDAREARMLSDEFADVSPEQVAECFTGATAAHVRRRRKAHGLDPETGVKGAGHSPVEKRERAIQLRRQDPPVSTRRIAEQLGVHQNQVMRWIRDIDERKAA